MAPTRSVFSHLPRLNSSSQNSRYLRNVRRGIAVSSKAAATIAAPTLEHVAPVTPSGFRRHLPPNLSSLPEHARKRQTAFDDLLNSITHSLVTTSRPSLPYLHSLLRSYSSRSEHWAQFAHGNSDKQYTRNLVCEVPGLFNLLLLVWTPGKSSPVHDHADAHCLMKVLQGEIRETRFTTPDRLGEEGPLVQTSDRRFGLDKVSYMADQLGLHSISNPHPTDFAVSLHLYTPPNAAMRGCNIYDSQSGEAKHVMQGIYDSVKGEASQSGL